MQANGAEMLRLACCLATERGIEVCAPVHDAVLICAPLERLDADVARMQDAMREASRIVLDGFELGHRCQNRPLPRPVYGRTRRRHVGARHEADPRAAAEDGGLTPGVVPKCGCCRTEMRIRQVSSMSPNTNSNVSWDPSRLRLKSRSGNTVARWHPSWTTGLTYSGEIHCRARRCLVGGSSQPARSQGIIGRAGALAHQGTPKG